MTTAAISLEVEPAPKRLGLCSNFIGAYEVCSRVITEDDIEMVELPPKNGHKQFICGHCVEQLLFAKPVIEEPEKDNSKGRKGRRTGARLPQGEDIKK